MSNEAELVEVARLFFIVGVIASLQGLVLTLLSLMMNLKRTSRALLLRQFWAPREALSSVEASLNRVGFAFMVIGLFNLLLALTLLRTAVGS